VTNVYRLAPSLNKVERRKRIPGGAKHRYDHYYGQSDKKVGVSLKRGPYFRKFRTERTVLKKLNTVPRPLFSKRGVAFARRVFFRTLPVLALRLRHPYDVNVIKKVEYFFLGWLRLSNLLKKKPEDPYINRYTRLILLNNQQQIAAIE